MLIITWLLSESVVRKKWILTPSSLAVCAYLLLVFLLGFMRFGYHQHRMQQGSEIAGLVTLYAWEEVQIEGVTKDRFRSSSGRINYDVQVLRSQFNGESWHQSYTIRLYENLQDGDGAQINRGDRIRATIRVFELERPRNPGQFDYRSFLQRQGIFVHGELLQSTLLERARSRSGWPVLAGAVHKRIDLLFNETTVPLAKALLTGYRQELDPLERQHFARAGLSHIMAVSGLHVGFIVAPFWLMIPWLWQWRYGGWTGLLLLTIILFCYAGLTGFSASVSRASLMAWLLSAGKLMKRMTDPVNLMGGSAIVLLLIDPSQLFEIGFQLSYSAVLVILLTLPVLQQAVPLNMRHTTAGKLLTVVLVSAIVQTGLYPVLVWYFGEFSIIGPLANALVVPILSIVVPLSFLLIPFADLLPELALMLNKVNVHALTWIGLVAEFLGSREGSWIRAHIDSGWYFILWAALAGLIASVRVPAVRYSWVVITLGVGCVIQLQGLADRLNPPELQVVVLDVGQGDAIFVKTPGGKRILIDAGRWSPSGNSGERVVIPYLEAIGADRLNAVFLSHPHADHIGGMPALLEHLAIDRIYHCGYEYDSRLFETYQSLVERKGIDTAAVRKGELIDIDPSIRIFIMGPDGRVHNRNPNDHSVVLKLVYNQTHFLFTGDAEEHQEERLGRTYGDFLKSNVLKAGHHGSRTSSNRGFLSWVQPDLAVVSLAFRNRYNHPHREAVTRLSRFTETIHYTSLEGAVTFISDGKTIRKEGTGSGSIERN